MVIIENKMLVLFHQIEINEEDTHCFVEEEKHLHFTLPPYQTKR